MVISAHDSPIGCKVFELVAKTYSNYDEDLPIEEILLTFLQTFSGHEDLYLMLPETTEWAAVMSGIAGHEDTLERLVLHHDGEHPLSTGFDYLYLGKIVSCLGVTASIDDIVRI